MTIENNICTKSALGKQGHQHKKYSHFTTSLGSSSVFVLGNPLRDQRLETFFENERKRERERESYLKYMGLDFSSNIEQTFGNPYYGSEQELLKPMRKLFWPTKTAHEIVKYVLATPRQLY
jgi:hypothetical protein